MDRTVKIESKACAVVCTCLAAVLRPTVRQVRCPQLVEGTFPLSYYSF